LLLFTPACFRSRFLAFVHTFLLSFTLSCFRSRFLAFVHAFLLSFTLSCFRSAFGLQKHGLADEERHAMPVHVSSRASDEIVQAMRANETGENLDVGKVTPIQ
jgi:hypothetical protein